MRDHRMDERLVYQLFPGIAFRFYNKDPAWLDFQSIKKGVFAYFKVSNLL